MSLEHTEVEETFLEEMQLENAGRVDSRYVYLPIHRLGFAEIKNEVVFYVGLNVSRIEECGGLPIEWDVIKVRLMNNKGKLIWLTVKEGKIVPE
ncbi:hypothetical protein [Paenibacillus sedimenti]|uniref:Uncharacterized protein n=1 Tax=Paenibacillus sedimenti TaxID=2770274 RepID=A0A926QN73_9BACL|nr:hypothetical protein [Paenibacillus sedimenti]MBD0384688.1 hypothetical protein [Paenibacillus sedimenti]